MTFNIEKIREDTPGVRGMVHFNNAGASLSPKVVVEGVIEHLNLEAQIGGYEAAARKREQIDYFYDAAALFLNASVEEIAFAENATRGWDMVFYAIPFKKGDRILTCVSEYASNYIAYLQVAQQKGVIIEVIPNDSYGQIDVEALGKMVDERVKLISITHVPTNGGLINPAKEIGKIAREANVLYLLDACQSVGQMPIDVKEIGCDMLNATGRKYLRGPRGTGLLYVKNSIIEHLTPPFLDLHAAEWTAKDKFLIRKDAKRFENWERYIAGQIGLGVAIGYASELGIEKIWERIRDLSSALRSELKRIKNICVNDLGEEQCGIVSFSVRNGNLEGIQKRLHEQKINISVSEKRYTLLDMEARHLDQVLRASVHYYNTEEEIGIFIQALKMLV